MSELLLISFDAVGDREMEQLLRMENFGRLAEKARIHTGVRTLFPSNTYPIHASIATGKHPCDHGIYGNLEIDPHNPKPTWNYSSRKIRSKTIWQAAAEKGLTVAGVFWPCTGYAPEIRYHIPETVHKRGESQIAASLKTGSKGLQLREIMRHGKELLSISQPALDNFATNCACDILTEYDPDLMLLHFTCYDYLCHRNGRGSARCDEALEILDRNLGRVLACAKGDPAVIVFSDHTQIDTHTRIDPNAFLEKLQLLELRKDGSVRRQKAFFQNQDGCAFFHMDGCTKGECRWVRDLIVQEEGVERLLTDEEMRVAGNPGASFGIAAKKGYYFYGKGNKVATHGYPPSYDDYTVFYLESGEGIDEGSRLTGGSLFDITRAVIRRLDLDMPEPEKEEA